MATVIFYEKPGCISNAKQKRILAKAGAKLEIKNLLTEKWNTETLRSFFCNKRKEEWVNNSAPAIKSGNLVVEKIDENELLQKMVREPLLIRRPLIEHSSFKTCGFNQDELSKHLDLQFEESVASNAKDLEACSSPKNVNAGCRPQ